MTWFSLNPQQVQIVSAVCEAVIPGSAATGPMVYIDSVAADFPPPQKAAFLASVDELAPVLTGGTAYLETVQFGGGFQWLRALAIEAYYSDFGQPGYTGPTAWKAIDFNSPEALRLKKDWSFLRCFQGGA
jgi:hypothetical protein